MRVRILCSLAFIGAAFLGNDAAAAPVTRHVDANRGVDSGDCTAPATPCATITYAMSQAVAGTPGDRVSVAPGTYNLARGEKFPIVMKSGVRLVGTLGIATSVIDATGANASVITSTGGNSSTLIRGFTIMGGVNTGATDPAPDGTPGRGGGVRLEGGDQATVDRNIFLGNDARGWAGYAGSPRGGIGVGGAIYVSGSARITNNVFSGNGAHGGRAFGAAAANVASGGAVYVDGGRGIVAGNTFSSNTARGGDGGDVAGTTGGQAVGGALAAFSDYDVANNIFVNNLAVPGTPVPPSAGTAPSINGAVFYNGRGVETNNLFFGNVSVGGVDHYGTAAVQADPLFSAGPSNLHISPASPAVDAGNAAFTTVIDHDGVLRAFPPAIGAYEPVADPVQPGPTTHALTIAVTGSGTVTSSPAGISCGGTCVSTFAAGTVVTLTAAPFAGSTFVGWAGGPCSGAGACTVTLNAGVSVTALFNNSSERNLPISVLKRERM